jgi:hypothetical protein
MIPKGEIERTLQSLDEHFQAASSEEEAQWFAKLAIIELCGWIEESMDEVVRRCARRHLKEPANQGFCDTTIIDRTYGFEYKKHFRSMLMQLLGLVVVEQLEQQINPAIYARMQGALSFLRPLRNSYAHTHLRTTTIINSPSVTKSKLLPIHEGLKEFDRVIRLGRWNR